MTARRGRLLAARRGLPAWTALLLALSAPALVTAAEVTSFVPQGTVKGVRQVTARFSEPMVPLADPLGTADPFEIACPEAGAGRWVDSRSWVYDFERDPPAGVRCTFAVRAGLTSLAGTQVIGRPPFDFSTGGPVIVWSVPEEGNETIDEAQAFILALDGEATEASLLAHVAFVVEGLPGRIGARVLSGKVREQILAARVGRSPPPSPGQVVVLQARQRFPNGARVSLVWGQGVATASGVANEEDRVVPFQVRPPFTATFHCERERRQAGCIPVTPMAIQFSAPVGWEHARQIAVVGPSGQRLNPQGRDEGSRAVWRVAFKGPFPEMATFRVEVPPGLRDDAGRPLANARAFPLTVRTESFPPLAKFSARFGIVEWKADPTLPVTLRNLEPELAARLLRVDQKPGSPDPGLLGWIRAKIFRIHPEHSAELLPWLRKVGAADRETSVFGPAEADGPLRTIALPRAHGAQAFEVLGIPLGGPGLYVVELESARLGASLLGGSVPQKPIYVPTAALVTNLSVHFKWGRETSLAWVTTLDHGRPAASARVTVYDCQGKARWQGETDRQGIARIGPLPARDALPRCPASRQPGAFADWSQTTALVGLDEGLLVVAQTREDLSFVHSSWDQGIEPWRFQLPLEGDQAGVAAHTILDRSLFRAGEIVHMRHLLRRRTLSGFGRVPDAERPTRVSIRHLGSEEHYDLALEWDAGGSALATWRIPKEAKLGRYEVVLVKPAARANAAESVPPTPEGEAPSAPDREWPSGQFRVEEFRVPLMRGLVRPPADPLIGATEFPLDVSVRYLAGGGASGHPVTVRTQIRRRTIVPVEEFEGFAFANGLVREGIVRRGADAEDESEEGPVESAGGRPTVHQRAELTLDGAGTARTVITRVPRAVTPREVLAELEFRDPNGEVQTAAATVPLWPARWLVGIKPEDWVASRDRLAVSVAVTDVAGRPVAGARPRVELFRRQSYSHRKRLVGGFYAYEHVEETRRIGELCQGVTDARGRLACEGKPPVDGGLVLQASATDEDGHTTAAHQSVWVAGSEEWWFEVRDHDRMDLLPERRRYEPGEIARFQVRMPFREATALVAVEREGVREAFVVPLSGKEPVIEVPVREVYAPNMFVSVLAVRGRIGDVQPTALVDLGRPAFKLGVAEIRVGWRAHELKVDVTTDRTAYRVRDTARARIAVRTTEGKAPPPGSEVAVAAVDEGLLDLSPNPSWSLLEAMMGRRGYAVETATAQMQVVGKRHFGLKAVAPGGGGGRQGTRELFDTLLLWKGRVPLDARGEAVVEVPLNDSLTSFRIVAVASGGLGLFGSGSTAIRATQDLMILPGIPPVVREGDRFRAEVTLRNATTRPMSVEARGTVEGLAGSFAPRMLTLAAGEAQVVGWALTAPAGVSALRYEIAAGEPGGRMDRIRVSQRVEPAVPVRTLQATLFQWSAPAGGPLLQPIEPPTDAVPGRGGVQVAFRSTLVEGLSGLREWMLRYPYTCLEQEVSRAIALRDEGRWREIAGALPASLDSDGLLKYFPTMSWGSEVLTAYVLAISQEAGWMLPPEVRGRMEGALVRFVEGGLRPRLERPTADLSIRKLAALEALSRTGKAEPRLLGSVAIEPALWPTSALLDWWSLLSRVPGVPERERRRREAEQILRTRLTFSGTMLSFSSERTDALWWLMVSGDTNAARLVLQLLETGRWKDDVPRILRGALARQKNGAWDLTVANAWGALAVERFSRAFEQAPVTGTSAATLAGSTQRIDWAGTPKGAALTLPWPAARTDLVVDHAGTGRPWVTVLSQAAIPLTAPLERGYRITKTLTPLEPRDGGVLHRGDLVRIRLEVDARSDMTWVVVADPVPTGASHVGTGLGHDPQRVSVGREAWRDRAWPAFQERGFEAFRAYYAYVPRGRFAVEYTIRLNQSGRFQLPPTRVEALYAPERFGELPNPALEVAP